MVHDIDVNIATMVADTYQDRLNEAMTDAGVDTAQLAAQLGVSYQAVRKAQDGRTKSLSAANNAAAAEILRVNPNWLAAGTGSKAPLFATATESVVATDRVDAVVIRGNAQPTVLIPAGSVGVPMLAIAASMGRGEDQPPEDIVTGTIAVSADWIAQQLRLDPNRLRFINGYGDSMSPTFNSGDVLLVDTGTTSVVVDGIYVLATDSRLFIKRVRERLDGRYEISSDNPLVKTVDELDGGHQVDVLGRVVWVWNGRKV